MEDMGYHGVIDIMQDGIGRIDHANSSADITGLYTEGLETCIAYMFISAKGVSLIHATSKLSPDSIANELHWHERILLWTAAYNPEYYPHPINNIAFQEQLARHIEVIESIAGHNTFQKNEDGSFKIYPADKGRVTLYPNARVDVDIIPNNRVCVSHRQLRFNINLLNNFFLADDETTPADFQFDGFQYTPLPSMLISHEMLKVRLQEPKFANSLLTRKMTLLYKQVNHQIAEIYVENFRKFDIGALAKSLNAKYGIESDPESSKRDTGDDSTLKVGLKQ